MRKDDKLRIEDAIAIRSRIRNGEAQVDLAREYDVSSVTISKIHRGILHAPVLSVRLNDALIQHIYDSSKGRSINGYVQQLLESALVK